jgi:HEAT repeat protein
MKRTNQVMMARVVAVLCLAGTARTASAEELPPSGTVYDKQRGELSVGTAAPTRERMVNAVRSASPTALAAILEYGQRVECFECIPLLEQKLLSSNDAQVREMAAWWLRQRAFGFGPVMVNMRAVATGDADPVRRARAATALGEFLDPNGLPTLQKVAKDAQPEVRVAAVRALGRLNVVAGNETLVVALKDASADVRRAALEQVLRVNFFRDDAAIVARLADDSASARRMAAQIAGELRIADALDPLLGLLMTDDDASVRQAAAIALGRLGDADARDALNDARRSEKDSGVLDAIDVAQRMR